MKSYRSEPESKLSIRLVLSTPAILAAVLLAFSSPGRAQVGRETPPIPLPHPQRVFAEQGVGGPLPDIDAVAAANSADPFDLAFVDENGQPLPPMEFTLAAVLREGGTPVPAGVNWRVFGSEPGPDGSFPLLADLAGGVTRLVLNPGRYYLHVMYGWAGATTQILVTPQNSSQTVVLNAGGLRLHGLIGDDDPIDRNELRFEVLGLDPALGEPVVITDDARQDDILRLSAGNYHVVSYYGQTNAIVRADIEVTAGLLTELSLYHEAARVTLKLVTSRGGEALANTAWSVLTPGGDLLFDSVGAFPTVVLAAGEYTAIAANNGLLYESDFIVESGRHRDIEVLATNPVQQAL